MIEYLEHRALLNANAMEAPEKIVCEPPEGGPAPYILVSSAAGIALGWATYLVTSVTLTNAGNKVSTEMIREYSAAAGGAAGFIGFVTALCAFDALGYHEPYRAAVKAYAECMKSQQAQ